MKLTILHTKLAQRIISGTFLGAVIIASLVYMPLLFTVILGIFLAIILFIEWPKLCATQPWLWLLTPFYPVMPIVMIMILNAHPIYRILIINMILIVAAHDTGSYIAGKLFGKHRILPRTSPNKTWEGFWGGYLLAVGIELCVLLARGKPVRPISLLFVIAVICVISLFGDMFESLLKRKARIKDTGSILPGHGGLLDRFDGLLFVAVFFHIYARQLINVL